MTISAKVVADSMAPHGVRLTTMQLRYPAMVHAELMTHRMLSKGASSSRAIPVKRMIDDVLNDPAFPVRWGKAKKGMQDDGPVNRVTAMDARWEWLKGRDAAVAVARELLALGLHKQVANRVLFPFVHMHVIVSATDWEGFFAQRCDEDADPTMEALAWAMLDARNASTPRVVREGEWHLPYVTDEERGRLSEQGAAHVSAARCARVSYANHDGSEPNAVADLVVADKLLAGLTVGKPGHMSPFEHQATPTHLRVYCANFRGWQQYRQRIAGENPRFNEAQARARLAERKSRGET